MLSKEMCLNALSELVFQANNDAIMNGDVFSDEFEKTLEQLIKEYFELVEEYKDTRKELECYYEMMSSPQPYKFEDLKPYMFVFDKEFNGWGEIVRIIDTFVNEYGEKLVRCFATGSDDIQIRSYKENRFFPVWMANREVEE